MFIVGRLVVLVLAFASGYLLLFDRGSAAIKEDGRIPFELHDNRIFVTARVNGKTCHLVLDTGGNGDTFLDKDFADELGLTLRKSWPITGAGSTAVSAYRSKVDSIVIHDLVMNRQPVNIVSFKEIREALGLKYLDGIVSSDVFRQYVVTIDFANKVVLLSTHDKFKPEVNALRIPFAGLNGSIPVVTGEVDGVPGKFIIDTGDRSTFTLFKNFALNHGFFSNYSLSDTVMTGYGLGGPILGRWLTLNELRVSNDLKATQVSARIPTITGGAFDRNDDLIGSIGNGLLATYSRVTFDYKNKVMFVVV